MFNPAALLGLAAVAAGLWFATSKASDGGGGGVSPKPAPGPSPGPSPKPSPGPSPAPSGDCQTLMAAYQSIDEAARQAVAGWHMNTVTSDAACKLVEARRVALSKLEDAGCEVPADDFDDSGVCEVNPACDSAVAALNRWSSLVAEGQIDAACQVQPAAQAAYDAMVQAGCDVRNWTRPAIDCTSGECAALQADLKQWGELFSALVAQGRIDEATQACPEYNKRYWACQKAGCDTGNWGPNSQLC